MQRTFRVEGMSCTACAASVESILLSLKGVAAVRVNLNEATVWIDYKPDQVTLAEMKEALEKVGYSLHEDLLLNLEEEEQHFRLLQSRLRNRVIIAFVFAVPVFVLAMFFHHRQEWYLWQAVLTLPVLWAGWNMIVPGFRRLIAGHSTMDSLVALGTTAAYIFSLSQMVLAKMGMLAGGGIHLYFESAAIIIAFVLLGKYFEDRARRNTNRSLKQLMGLQVKRVIRVSLMQDEEVDIQSVRVGDLLRVPPGSKVPLDGCITEGTTYIDESMITGESMPVFRQPGDKVVGGTLNQSGSLVIRVEKTGADTLLAGIIRQVREAQASKAPVQRLADRIASVFVPVVIVIALLSFFAWLIFDPDHNIYRAFNALFAVLVISCPCAWGLATPTAIAVAMGQLAQKGILIKNAESLERMTQLDAIAIDKTGTLTRGMPQVTSVFSLTPLDSQTWEAIVAIESRSEHPLARAIVAYKPSRSVDIVVEDYQYTAGMGVSATVGNQKYLIGNELYIRSSGIAIDHEFVAKAAEYQQKGQTVVWVADGRSVLALFAIADPVKDNAVEAVQKLNAQGIEIHLLSGDNEQVVAVVAQQLGISRYKGQMLPAEKMAYLRSLQQKTKRLGMAGDGVNDAPALSQADVSFAMSTGTDVAIETADVTLLHGDISKISYCLSAAKITMNVIRQNLFWAFFYNIIAIPLAAGVFYPIWHISLNPMIAGIAMSLSSVTVVSNSLRLRLLIK